MIRFIIPLIAVILFFLEPVFSLFSPVSIADVSYTLVPRFVIVYLIFITVYYRRKQAMIYGIILGLLYDMYYIDIIGVYTFLYPVICYLFSCDYPADSPPYHHSDAFIASDGWAA